MFDTLASLLMAKMENGSNQHCCGAFIGNKHNYIIWLYTPLDRGVYVFGVGVTYLLTNFMQCFSGVNYIFCCFDFDPCAEYNMSEF